MECIFCKIIDNEINSFTIFEDNNVKVILEIHPKSLGEMLIIAKKHIKDVKELDDETAVALNNTIKKMYELLEKKLNIAGLSIIQNNGIAAEIKHFHIHLIPKYKKKNLINKTELKEVFNVLIS